MHTLLAVAILSVEVSLSIGIRSFSILFGSSSQVDATSREIHRQLNARRFAINVVVMCFVRCTGFRSSSRPMQTSPGRNGRHATQHNNYFVLSGTGRTLRQTCVKPDMLRRRAAIFERSIILPLTNGPRSVIRTTAERPFLE